MNDHRALLLVLMMDGSENQLLSKIRALVTKKNEAPTSLEKFANTKKPFMFAPNVCSKSTHHHTMVCPTISILPPLNSVATETVKLDKRLKKMLKMHGTPTNETTTEMEISTWFLLCLGIITKFSVLMINGRWTGSLTNKKRVFFCVSAWI